MKLSGGAKKLYDFIPDRCWMTERHLAKGIGCRTSKISLFKDELEMAGLIDVLLNSNGRRSNPRHEIIKRDRPRRSPICKHIHRSYALTAWGTLGRNELVECYLKSEWEVLPFGERAKKPLQSLSLREWGHRSQSDKLDFFFNHPHLNIGLVVCRHMLVVDIDSKKSPWIQHENFGATLTVTTPRGFHFYFRNDPMITTSAKAIPNVDTRCYGSFLLLPGSTHPEGGKYQWSNITTPRSIPLTFRKEWRQGRFEAQKGKGRFVLPTSIPEGSRNDTLWRYGRSLRSAGRNFFEIEAALSVANRNLCSPALPSRELRRLIENIDSRPNKSSFRDGI